LQGSSIFKATTSKGEKAITDHSFNNEEEIIAKLTNRS